jgi:hypothetical protein
VLALVASSSSSHGADALDTFVEELRLADERYRLERLRLRNKRSALHLNEQP